MTAIPVGRIGIIWRGDAAARSATPIATGRLQPVFDELAARGVLATPIVFDDDVVDEVRSQLLALDGVLVWVDPIMGETDRTVLDAMLRDVAARGVWVSAHPDVIMKMGTKEILVLTRDLACGSDTHLYRTFAEYRSQFPARVATGPRVVKRQRGNGGIGVWKVMLAADAVSGDDLSVDVQDAHPRGIDVETMPLTEFMRRCEAYFTEAGSVIDQPFQPRIVDGMVRCYLVRDRVAGFALQEADPAHGKSDRIFGLPAKKTMIEAEAPRFAPLKARMEMEWLPAIRELARVEIDALPMLWDADFLLGPRDRSGADTYVLCEINVSCITPFPEAVPGKVADAVASRLLSGI